MKIERCGPYRDWPSLLPLIRSYPWPPELGADDDDSRLLYYASSWGYEDANGFLREGGELLGWYRYMPFGSPDGPEPAAHVLDLAVAPARRRQGLGRLLMEDLCARAREDGVARLWSRVFADNAASLALHRAAGFRERGRWSGSVVLTRGLGWKEEGKGESA